jgi:hypothetical protein
MLDLIAKRTFIGLFSFCQISISNEIARMKERKKEIRRRNIPELLI